jgi:biotin carboxyl carrier protein
MKLTAEISGEKLELNIKRDGERVVAEIDGRPVEIVVRESAEGFYLLLAGSRVYPCRVERNAARREAFEVHVGTRTFEVALSDPKRLGSAAELALHGDTTAQIVAPMPGKIVRVLVELGAQVEAGDGVVVVEAMKMQNEMKSPKAGTVVALHTEAGATVNAGDVLAVIE